MCVCGEGGWASWIVKSKLNKFEHDQSSGAGPCTDSGCWDPVQCTVRSELNKFEHVVGGRMGPVERGLLLGLGPCTEDGQGWGPEQGQNGDRMTQLKKSNLNNVE